MTEPSPAGSAEPTTALGLALADSQSARPEILSMTREELLAERETYLLRSANSHDELPIADLRRFVDIGARLRQLASTSLPAKTKKTKMSLEDV